MQDSPLDGVLRIAFLKVTTLDYPTSCLSLHEEFADLRPQNQTSK